MKYDLTINQHNIKPHLDIQKGIEDKKNGLYTFSIRVNQGDIEDFVIFETVTIKDYAGITWSGWRESGVSYGSRTGSTENAVRPGEH
jgi:hypothetical protein